MKLLLIVLMLACWACTSTATKGPSQPLPPGTLLVFLPGTTPSTTPPPGEIGLTEWSIQMNQLDHQYPFIIYEHGYTGNYLLTSHCVGGSNPSATAKLSPANRGPGTMLIVTSASTFSLATCTFSVHDEFGQRVSLSAGFPL